MTDLTIAKILDDAATRSVFDQIVRKRRVRIRDLSYDKGSRQDLRTALDRLKEQHLIEERTGPANIDQLSTLLVTKEGLMAARLEDR